MKSYRSVLKFISEFDETLTSVTLKSLLQRSLLYLSQILEAKFVSIAVFNEANNGFDVYMLNSDGILSEAIEIDLKRTYLGKVFITEKTVTLNRQQLKAFNFSPEDILNNYSYETLYLHTLKYGQLGIGTLNLGFEKEEDFTDSIIEFIPIIAQRFSLAIHTTKLYNEIQRSEEKYRKIIEFAPMGIVIVQMEHIVYCNNKLANLLDYDSNAELIATPMLNYIHPEFRDMAKNRFQGIIMKKKGVELIEETFIRKDGSYFDVEVLGHYCVFNGKPAIQGYIMDVSSKKKHQKAVTKIQSAISGNIGQAFFNSVVLAITKTLGSDYAFVSIASLDEPGPMETMETISFSDTDKLLENITFKIKGTPCQIVLDRSGKYYTSNVKTVFPDSEQAVNLDINGYFGVPLYDSQQNLLGILVALFRDEIKDIEFVESILNIIANRTGAELERMKNERERKRLMDEVIKSKNKFEQLFNNASDAILLWEITADGEIQKLMEVNKAACQLLGYSQEEFKYLLPIQLINNGNKQKISEILKEVFIKHHHQFEIQYEHKNGEIIDVEIHAHLFRLENTDVIMSVARDIRERKQMEEQLFQASKLDGIGQLAGGIAHDFNNILTAISGYTELMKLNTDSKTSNYNLLEGIAESSKRAESLVKQLLGFSRKQIIQPGLLDINDSIKSLKKMLSRLIGEDIHLDEKLSAEIPHIFADAVQIEQILINFVVNARDAINAKILRTEEKIITIRTYSKYLDENDHIHFPTLKSDNYVVIEVSDTGVGMSKDIINKIFEPFFSTKPKDKGTGLGLATVYGIVKQNHGELKVQSEPGEGTTMSLYWPATDKRVVNERPLRISKKIKHGSETILLVEDDSSVLSFTSKALSRLGYIVLEATNGVEALKLIYENKLIFDILVIDIVMPRMGGHELAKELLKSDANTKILFTTGYTDDDSLKGKLLGGKINLINKPYTIEELSSKIRQILES